MPTKKPDDGLYKRHKAFRARMMERGFRQLSEWIHDLDREKAAAYLARLRKQREKELA